MAVWDSRIFQHWGEQLGVDAALFLAPGVTVHADPEMTDKLIVFDGAGRQTVLLPSRFAERLTSDDLPAGDALIAGLSARIGMPLELAWRDYYFYATAPCDLPCHAERIRPLTAADAPLLADLQAACEARELELSKVNIDDPYIVGYFDGAALAGAGSLLIGEHDLYDIGVLTHPDHRKRGIGAALTACLWREIDLRGGVAQYVTIAENYGSVGVARRCGLALFMTEEGWSFPTP